MEEDKYVLVAIEGSRMFFNPREHPPLQSTDHSKRPAIDSSAQPISEITPSPLTVQMDAVAESGRKEPVCEKAPD